MKKHLLLTVILILVQINLLWAFSETLLRPIETFSSLSIIGPGSRARGLGGAYLALSDDSTGGDSNPAGLVILNQCELAFSGGYVNRIEDLEIGIDKKASGKQTVSQFNLQYLGISKPFVYGNKFMCLSLFYRKRYLLDRKWNLNIQRKDNYIREVSHIDYQSEGGLSSLGLSFCYRVKKYFSFGIFKVKF
ncbi:conserved hypothetical protein, secreted [Candidatus Magnetomorum sp. HK-1]|nr:conserved hypothetical protein, secreted [Candidatus Magnetomorum sp. HK-1]